MLLPISLGSPTLNLNVCKHAFLKRHAIFFLEDIKKMKLASICFAREDVWDKIITMCILGGRLGFLWWALRPNIRKNSNCIQPVRFKRLPPKAFPRILHPYPSQNSPVLKRSAEMAAN
jgi:hypothetical protein